MEHSEHIELINNFYTAFQKREVDKMTSCYHQKVTFNDPVFKNLNGVHASNMWRMLLSQADKNMKIRYSDVWANEVNGGAMWEADYLFTKTGRLVKNRIITRFKFKDNKIIDQVDTFNIWKWSGMALGPVGYALGFTPFMKKKIQKTANRSLEAFEKKLSADKN